MPYSNLVTKRAYFDPILPILKSHGWQLNWMDMFTGRSRTTQTFMTSIFILLNFVSLSKESHVKIELINFSWDVLIVKCNSWLLINFTKSISIYIPICYFTTKIPKNMLHPGWYMKKIIQPVNSKFLNIQPIVHEL